MYHVQFVRSCRPIWSPATRQTVSPQLLPLTPSNPYWKHTLGWRTAATHSSGGLPADIPALSLERAIGERQGVDSALWATGAFHAQVYPDLPFAATWVQLAEKLLHRSKNTDADSPPVVPRGNSGGLIVKTVGAQCRSRNHLRELMISACSAQDANVPADALLLVSGSHPARQLPFARSVLQNSFSMLKDAQSMRLNGELPSNTSLWAVENPILPPERLQEKIDAGAEVILTQPPFARATAERWFQNAAAIGAEEKAVKILAGVPMASSVSNLEFWMRLCGLAGSSEADEVVRSFPVAGNVEGGKPGLEMAVREWNAEFVRWVLSLPGVGGLHVMPLTKSGRDMTAAFLADGTLPSGSTKHDG